MRNQSHDRGGERTQRCALAPSAQGLGGLDRPGSALEQRSLDRGTRAEASRKLAERWAKQARDLVSRKGESRAGAMPPAGVLLGAGRPDFIARKRDVAGEHWIASGGRGFMLDPASPLARADFLVIGDAHVGDHPPRAAVRKLGMGFGVLEPLDAGTDARRIVGDQEQRVAVIARRRITDGQTGYRAFSPAAAARAEVIHDFNYAQVITLDLLAKGYRYLEVPISYHFRTTGESFIKLGPYLRKVVPAVYRELNAA